VPSLVLGGKATAVLHVSQIADALGLAPPADGSPIRDARDCTVILDAWLARIEGLGWELLLTPTPSRGRSLRNLTVNVFHPFELLPMAWETGRFEWYPEEDDLRESQLGERAAFVAYAKRVASAWRDFGFVGDRSVETPRGEVSWSALVAFQRWHAAYHFRQLVVSLGGEFDLELDDLALPAQVF
jgi:hypothetical protein